MSGRVAATFVAHLRTTMRDGFFHLNLHRTVKVILGVGAGVKVDSF